MRRSTLALLPLVLSCAASAATVVHCGRLLDVQKGELIPNAAIVIEGGAVVASGAGISVPAGAGSIDLSHGVCLPGLIDVHDHLTADPKYMGYESLGISVPRATV